MGPLEHQGEGATDEARAEEAKKFLAASPARQLVAELLERLRKSPAPWWSPVSLRAKWSAADRMSWLASRPDLRQRITSRLTGLAPKAARKKSPDFQAGLIDSVVDEGDIDARDLDQAFAPEDLAVYGPVEAFWRAFLEALPMDAKDKDAEELAAWLLDALLAGVSGLAGGFSRAPILTPLDVRLAIDGTLWQTKLPVEVRVAIDRARLAHEKDRREPRFGAGDELAFATPAVLARTFSLRELEPVLVAAEKALGFGAPPRVEAPPPVRPAAISGPPPSSIGRPAPSPLTAAMIQASSSARPARGSVAPVPPGLQPMPPALQPMPPRSSNPPLPPPPASAPPPSRKPASVAPLPPPPLPVEDRGEFAEVSENELEPTTNPWEPEGRDTPQDEPDLPRPRR